MWIQDTTRKRRQDNGPWTGGLYSTNNGSIIKLVTDLTWNNARDIIAKLKTELTEDRQRSFSFKKLERDMGLLCHMAMTYDQILPFLKVFHLNLCSHTRQRNKTGWKIQDIK